MHVELILTRPPIPSRTPPPADTRRGIPPYFVNIDGRKLERLRKKSGMTQAILAKQAGMSGFRLRTLEDGSAPRIRGDRAEGLASALACDLSKILKTAAG
jgi:DNA-binding Xre family transcriptional regulator